MKILKLSMPAKLTVIQQKRCGMNIVLLQSLTFKTRLGGVI